MKRKLKSVNRCGFFQVNLGVNAGIFLWQLEIMFNWTGSYGFLKTYVISSKTRVTDAEI
jgi:hypothetical protein